MEANTKTYANEKPSLWQQFREWWNVECQVIYYTDQTNSQSRNLQFTYGKLVLYSTGAFAFVVVLTTTLIFFTSIREQIPGYTDKDLREKQAELVYRVHELEAIAAEQDSFIRALQRVPSLNDSQLATAPRTAPVPAANPQVVQSAVANPVEEVAPITRRVRYAPERQRFLPPIDPKLLRVSAHFQPEKGHYGIDLGAPENTYITASSSGKVFQADYSLEHGYIIGIQHAEGFTTYCKHNSRLLARVGQYVRAGYPIAVIGNTGERTNGPHLHFELWRDGSPLNPADYINLGQPIAQNP